MSKHTLEHALYRSRPDLWAVMLTLRHAKRLKRLLWDALTDEERAILTEFANQQRNEA